MQKILFFLNEGSGDNSITVTELQEQIQLFFEGNSNFQLDFYIPKWETENVEDVFLGKIKNDIDCVVAAGGDGTVNFVAQHIYGKNIQLGIIPFGSANGLAKNLMLPLDLKASLEVVVKQKTLPVSSLKVNGNFCIHLADLGLNAKIVRRFEKENTRGFFGYFQAFWKEIFNNKKIKCKIIADNQTFEKEVFMMVFCNGTGYGTGLTLNPNGKFDDDKFEIVNLEIRNITDILAEIKQDDVEHPQYLQMVSCKKAEVLLEEPAYLQVDGEFLGKTKHIKVEINSAYIPTLIV